MLHIRRPDGRSSNDWQLRHWLWDWRGHLTQMFLCTLTNRIEAQKYQEAKKAQRNLRAALPRQLVDYFNKKALKRKKLYFFYKI